jgi:hypothetical protein
MAFEGAKVLNVFVINGFIIYIKRELLIRTVFYLYIFLINAFISQI